MYCFNQSAREKSKDFCVNMLSVLQEKMNSLAHI